MSEHQDWIERAIVDLETARFVRTNPRLPALVPAFHYQQAAEKALKGALIAEGKVPPRVHDLRVLLEEAGQPTSCNLVAAEALSPYAVLARYPGWDEAPSAQELDLFDAFAASCIDWAGAVSRR